MVSQIYRQTVIHLIFLQNSTILSKKITTLSKLEFRMKSNRITMYLAIVTFFYTLVSSAGEPPVAHIANCSTPLSDSSVFLQLSDSNISRQVMADYANINKLPTHIEMPFTNGVSEGFSFTFDGLCSWNSTMPIKINNHVNDTFQQSDLQYDFQDISSNYTSSIDGTGESIIFPELNYKWHIISSDNTTHFEVEGPVFNYVFTSLGTYTIQLSVLSNNGNIDTSYQTLVVSEIIPTPVDFQENVDDIVIDIQTFPGLTIYGNLNVLHTVNMEAPSVLKVGELGNFDATETFDTIVSEKFGVVNSSSGLQFGWDFGDTCKFNIYFKPAFNQYGYDISYITGSESEVIFYDGDGTISTTPSLQNLGWEYETTPGSECISSGNFVRHKFNSPGIYDVKLKVVDQLWPSTVNFEGTALRNGLETVTSHQIVVNTPPTIAYADILSEKQYLNEADFFQGEIYENDRVYLLLTRIDDLISTEREHTWSIDFGDDSEIIHNVENTQFTLDFYNNTVETEGNSIHTYQKPGIYNISVTSSDGYHSSEPKVIQIEVKPRLDWLIPVISLLLF